MDIRIQQLYLAIVWLEISEKHLLSEQRSIIGVPDVEGENVSEFGYT